ncbi:uncharacterized protein LOC128241928 [Mya arenaria]|uniref:uncharacterized protein LOC128241928 n=1 Tax=Mya arenaria TaxID=6604 RepID=UPI0022E4B595|nr:uncharacterized protein LOC128241928 [Mya arenaria]
MDERQSSARKPLNTNWYRCWQSVCITHAVLVDLTTDGFDRLQQETIDYINSLNGFKERTICSSCNTINVLPCWTKNLCKGTKGNCEIHSSPALLYGSCPTNGFCNEFVSKLVESHRFGSPVWANTDAAKWCSNGWEIAKCFMPPSGYADKANAKETDVNGLISCIINCTFFQQYFHDDLSKPNSIAAKAKEHVTKLRHNPDMELTENQTTSLIEDFINLLDDETYLRKNDKAIYACEQLIKVKDGCIEFTESEVANLMSCIRDVESNFKELQCCFQRCMLNAQQCMHVGSQMLAFSQAGFREDLKTLYKTQHNTLPVYPSVPEIDDNIDNIYVKPKIIQLDKGKYDRTSFHSNTLRHGQDWRKRSVTTLRNMFYKRQQHLQNVYIQGEPGVGKTSFCSMLAILWSNTQLYGLGYIEKTPPFTDVETIKEYDFLFLVALRDFSGYECNVEEMIWRLIVKRMRNKQAYPRETLTEIMCTAKCLILLDGLDEWVHPKTPSESCICGTNKTIPFRVQRENCTFVTTTRPWKMAYVFVKDSEVDRRLEILGVNDPHDLIGKVLDSLNKRKGETKTSDAFLNEVGTRGLNHLLEIPIIHMHLLCLWHDDRALEPSVCKIYSSMLDMLFGRAMNSRPHQDQSHELSSGNLSLPISLADDENLQENKTLVVSLAQLAFNTLQSREQESSIVFKKTQVNEYLSKSELEFALNIGILTQRQSLSSTKPVLTYSFLHKTFQEFFAALHLANNKGTESESIFLLHGNKIKVHDISLLFIFSCGLCPETAQKISIDLMRSISESCAEELHRKGTETPSNQSRHLAEIVDAQHIILQGFHEGRNNGNSEIKLTIRHVAGHIPKGKYCLWKELVETNKDHIETLLLDETDTTTEDVTFIQDVISSSRNALRYVHFRNQHGSYDLNQCGKLRYLYIENTDHDCHTCVDINSTDLMTCIMNHVTPATEKSVISSLTRALKLRTLQIHRCRDSGRLLEAMSELRSLEQVKICNTDFAEDQVLVLPECI